MENAANLGRGLPSIIPHQTVLHLNKSARADSPRNESQLVRVGNREPFVTPSGIQVGAHSEPINCILRIRVRMAEIGDHDGLGSDRRVKLSGVVPSITRLELPPRHRVGVV